MEVFIKKSNRKLPLIEVGVECLLIYKNFKKGEKVYVSDSKAAGKASFKRRL